MTTRLCDIRKITPGDTLYRFECPEVAAAALPGQFVEVRVLDGLEPFFRRPISVFDAEGSYFDLLVRTVGKGTALMTQWEIGQEVDIIGPLGNGFSWERSEDDFLLAGGGIGVAPLHFLARRLRAEGKDFRIFFSPARDSQLLDSFAPGLKADYLFCSNRKEVGPVLRQALSDRLPDRVFTCGPDPFMEKLIRVCKEFKVPVQASKETHMACGIGICIGCVIPVLSEGEVVYKKVCSDGPVFSGEELIFDE